MMICKNKSARFIHMTIVVNTSEICVLHHYSFFITHLSFDRGKFPSISAPLRCYFNFYRFYKQNPKDTFNFWSFGMLYTFFFGIFVITISFSKIL